MARKASASRQRIILLTAMFGRHVSAISRIQTTTIKPAAFRHASFSRTIHPKLRTRIRSFTAATTFVSSLDIGFSVTPRQLSTAVVSNLLVVDRGRRTSSYNCFSHRTSKSGAPRRFTQPFGPLPSHWSHVTRQLALINHAASVCRTGARKPRILAS